MPAFALCWNSELATVPDGLRCEVAGRANCTVIRSNVGSDADMVSFVRTVTCSDLCQSKRTAEHKRQNERNTQVIRTTAEILVEIAIKVTGHN